MEVSSSNNSLALEITEVRANQPEVNDSPSQFSQIEQSNSQFRNRINELVRDAKTSIQWKRDLSTIPVERATSLPGIDRNFTEYNRIVHLAKTSKSISNSDMRQFMTVVSQVFNKRINQLSGVTKMVNDTQNEIKMLIDFLEKHPGLSTNREKIICLDLLIEDVVALLENDNSATLTSDQPKYEISKTQDAEGRTIYRLVSNQPPPIKNICLRGGGGKGLGYVGMLSELARQGKLDQLESVAGSSAGGIASMALSIGVPCDQLGDFCTQIQNGIGRRVSSNAIKKMPFLENKFPNWTFNILGSAAGIIPAVDNAALKSVGEFLKTIAGESNTLPFEQDGDKFTFNGVAISSDEQQRLEQLFANYQNPNRVINEGDLITFADLALLKRLDTTGSHHFRDLTLTGWDGTDQKEIYFNAQNYPNMPIAYATRITMALPGAFKRVDMDIERFRAGNNNPSETNPNNVHRLFDGGLGSNSPSEVFIKPLSESSTNEDRLEYQKAQQETLTCIFDGEGQGYFGQSFGFKYSENPVIQFFLWLLDAIGSMDKMEELRDNENEKLNNVGNTLVVGHGHLWTLSMNPEQEEVDAANLMSALQAIEFCRQRKDQVYYLESPDPQLLINKVPVKSQHALRAQIDSFEVNS